MKVGKIFYIVILNLFFIVSAFSYDRELVVTSVVTDTTIQIQRLDKQLEILPGDMFAIFSHETNKILGYSRVISITDNSDFFVAKVETHNKSGIIRPLNYLKKIDFKKSNTEIPARYDLVYRDDSGALSMYRPLVYAGLVQGMTASNLQKKEVMVGPTIFSYGITSATQLNVGLATSLFGVANASVKNKLIGNDEYDLSIENGFQYYTATRKGNYQLNINLDSASISNFKSYTKFKLFTKKPEDQTLTNSEEYTRPLNLELQFSTGYMLPNWNQIIFGPKVDINKKRVGGLVAYYFIEKNFSSMIALSSADFSEFRIGRQGYLFNLDFWWRF